MGDWNAGSVIEEVGNRTDNIPSALSGTGMANIINQRLEFINGFLSTNHTNTGIVDAIQGPLVELTKAKLLVDIETQGTDATETSLGEFKIKKGTGSSALSSAKALKENAMKDLAFLKGKAKFFKALG